MPRHPETRVTTVLDAADGSPGNTAEPATSQPQQIEGKSRRGTSARYGILVFVFVVIGLGALWSANRAFAPEMYDTTTPADIGRALAGGQNYAVFDLNVNIREIRDAQLAHLQTKPDVILLGASHWQEAHVELIPDKVFLNAHIHRDYYEDILGMVDMLVRHDKLPGHLLIAIRDNQFMPMGERTDHLWLPGIPFYRSMADRLGLQPHPVWQTLPVARWRELVSLQMLFGNAARWYKADEWPHATPDRQFGRLDTLLAGGSIVWSHQHEATYTPQRSHATAMAYVNARRNQPPSIDPIGVASIDRLLGYLKGRGVDVVLVHPPFNPVAYDALKTTPYIDGLRRVEAVTRDLADQHGFRVIGSFDPHAVGCDAGMYIDAEHANPTCLAKVLSQFGNSARDRAPQAIEATEPVTIAPELVLLDPMPPPTIAIEGTPATAATAPIVDDHSGTAALIAPAPLPPAMPPAVGLAMPMPARPTLSPRKGTGSSGSSQVKAGQRVAGKPRPISSPRTTRLLSRAPTAVRN